ncbi:hypothetical protein [Salmonella enterica]
MALHSRGTRSYLRAADLVDLPGAVVLGLRQTLEEMTAQVRKTR